MFQTRLEDATACDACQYDAWRVKAGLVTYHGEQVRIAVQTDDAEGIEPLPEGMCSFVSREGLDLVCATVVDGFGLEEDDEQGCYAGQGGLQPEDVPPGAEGDDDSTDKGACKG